MSRRISQPFRSRAIEQLARQLLFAPPDKRIEQVGRAEKLHDQIEPGIAYPFEFISYRVTGYRSEAREESLLVGEAILPDLRLLIDMLSRSCDVPPPGDDPVETPEELAARLNVGTRTVARWRMMGLRWRWVVSSTGSGGGHRRLVLARSAVNRFLAQNKTRVERASRFSQIAPEDRAKIIERARRIAQAKDVSLNQVATHLAQRTGRAVETIRLLLANHDARNPGYEIFIDRTGPLTARQKRVIVRAHRMGVRTMKIARHFRRTRTTIFRVITQHRAAAIRRRDIRFVASPIFTRDDADEVILRPLVSDDKPAARHGQATPPPLPPPETHALFQDLPPVLRPLFTSPVPDAESQRSMLVRYNYLKFKADQLRGRLARHEPRVGDLEQIEAWLRRAVALRREFAASSQRIVLSVARRHLIGQPDASPNTLLDLLDVGQEVLLEAIETYDATKDHEFESYLTWALMKRFASDPAGRPKAHRRPDAEALAKRIATTGLSTDDALEEKLEAMEEDVEER